MAYYLFGILDVNMPLLYDEGGSKAFMRLQEHVLAASEDYTLFLWEAPSSSHYIDIIYRPSDPQQCYRSFLLSFGREYTSEQPSRFLARVTARPVTVRPGFARSWGGPADHKSRANTYAFHCSLESSPA